MSHIAPLENVEDIEAGALPAADASTRRLVLAAASALTACALLGTALSPYLVVEHPLVLLGLNPDGRHLLLAVGGVEPWQAVLVGSLRRSLSFLATFAVARVYSQPFIDWLSRRQAWIQRSVRWFEAVYERLGVWLVLMMPFYWVAAIAGTAQMSWRKFTLAMLPGQVAYVLGLFSVGTAIEAWTAPVLQVLESHSVELTGAALTLVAAQVLWSRWQKRARARTELTLATDVE